MLTYRPASLYVEFISLWILYEPAKFPITAMCSTKIKYLIKLTLHITNDLYGILGVCFELTSSGSIGTPYTHSYHSLPDLDPLDRRGIKYYPFLKNEKKSSFHLIENKFNGGKPNFSIWVLNTLKNM